MKNSPFSGKKVEVLLLKPLLGKGNAGDIIEVKTHYALHVLVPKEIAVIYDQQTKNQQSTQMTRIAKLKEAEQAKVKEMLATIEADGGLTFSKQATEDDSLYDSITNRSLLAYASKTFGVTLQPKNFEIDKIESLGEYVAKFTYQDIAQDIAIHVTRATTTEIEETA